MNRNKINEINFFKANSPNPLSLNGNITINSNDTNVKSFKDTISNMISEMNEVTNKPSELTQEMLQGKADIQDVMVAIAKSELTVQTATTITGKILQTYEKIMQIQI